MELKGITPVIALVMLMLITVGVVGVSYLWFGGLLSSQTKKFISIPAGGAYCTGGEIKAYVLNNGDSPITTQDIIVAQVDGVNVLTTPFFGDMKSGLIGWWKFDENSGGTAYDSSGVEPPNNGNLQPSCPNCPVWTNGKVRNALQFDGVDDYVNVPNSATISPTGNLTMTAWFKLASNAGTVSGNYFEIADPSGGDFAVMNNGANNLLSVSGVGLGETTGTTPLIVGTWYFGAVVFVVGGSGSQTIYLNGITEGSASGSLALPDRAMKIGSRVYQSNNYFNGAIDDVKIYNKANGNVNIQPGGSGLVINYPGIEGRHTVRIGTFSGIAETSVTCG